MKIFGKISITPRAFPKAPGDDLLTTVLTTEIHDNELVLPPGQIGVVEAVELLPFGRDDLDRPVALTRSGRRKIISEWGRVGGG